MSSNKMEYSVLKIYTLVLTSTLTPSIGNTLVCGNSLGMYRKNSCLPLYHLTVYRGSPSRSYWHCSDTVSPGLTAAGTVTATFFKPPTPAKRKDIWLKFVKMKIKLCRIKSQENRQWSSTYFTDFIDNFNTGLHKRSKTS